MPRPVDEQTMKERRGQFFTTSADVQEAMASLLTHAPSSSRCLEPSAGAGDLVSTLERHGYEGIDAIEFDQSIDAICKTEIEHGSFFRYARGKEGRYDIIFGNPPYVAWKNLEDSQKTDRDVLEIKNRGYSDKCNFYLLFIDRCIDLLSDGGEVVLIVPKEWLYSTSAAPLREKMKRDVSHAHHRYRRGEGFRRRDATCHNHIPLCAGRARRYRPRRKRNRCRRERRMD